MNAAWPLGVDMLEWKKAEAFYKTHREDLDTFLSSTEAAFVQTSRKPYESLALILSAKEAVFKALGLSWMGLSGFRSIQIVPGKTGFSFRLKRGLQAKLPRKIPLELSFTKTRRHVVASCHPCKQVLCAGI
jgi:phosphopantetheine--protein transferase-like protein